jgi:hypothetical protein
MKFLYLIFILLGLGAFAQDEPNSPGGNLKFPPVADVSTNIQSFEKSIGIEEYTANIDRIERECIDLLASENAKKKYAAVEVLGQLRSIRASEKLVAMIDFKIEIFRSDYSDSLAPYPCCRALIAIGKPAIEFIEKRLKIEKDEKVRKILSETQNRLS